MLSNYEYRVYWHETDLYKNFPSSSIVGISVEPFTLDDSRRVKRRIEEGDMREVWRREKILSGSRQGIQSQ